MCERVSVVRLILIFMIWCLPAAHAEVPRDILNGINSNYLKDIKPIFQQKCMSCHSSQAVKPWYGHIPLVSMLIDHDMREGTEHMDMAFDFPFRNQMDKDSEDDLEQLSEVAKTRSMPPVQYWILHWSSRLTNQETKVLSLWATESLEKLRKAQAPLEL